MPPMPPEWQTLEDGTSRANNVNPAESPTAKAMDRAIDFAIEGNSPYP